MICVYYVYSIKPRILYTDSNMHSETPTIALGWSYSVTVILQNPYIRNILVLYTMKKRTLKISHKQILHN